MKAASATSRRAARRRRQARRRRPRRGGGAQRDRGGGGGGGDGGGGGAALRRDEGALRLAVVDARARAPRRPADRVVSVDAAGAPRRPRVAPSGFEGYPGSDAQRTTLSGAGASASAAGASAAPYPPRAAQGRVGGAAGGGGGAAARDVRSFLSSGVYKEDDRVLVMLGRRASARARRDARCGTGPSPPVAPARWQTFGGTSLRATPSAEQLTRRMELSRLNNNKRGQIQVSTRSLRTDQATLNSLKRGTCRRSSWRRRARGTRGR